jgi:heat shock protein HslJ
MIGRIVGLALLLPVLAACGDEPDSTIDAVPAADLGIGGDYVSNGLPAPFADGDVMRLTLADGSISFQATCNSMSGNATWGDGVLRVDSIGGTEMGCPGAGFDQDEWLVDFFSSKPAIAVDGDDVSITRGEDTLWFVPAEDGGVGAAAPGVRLDGTVWSLTGIEETDGDSVGITGVPGKVEATLTIQGDRIQIETGCNTGGGRVTVVDDRLELRNLGFTLKGCLDVAGEVERGVLHVLDGGPLTWRINGTQLRLENGDHALVYDAE